MQCMRHNMGNQIIMKVIRRLSPQSSDEWSVYSYNMELVELQDNSMSCDQNRQP